MSARDRRRAVRRAPGLDEPISRVRIRAGRELRVIDISSAGALVEGDTRLLPGTHTDIHIVTPDGRVLVRSRIVRAYVSHISRDRLLYHGALAFEQPIHIGAGYGLPTHAACDNGVPGNDYPQAAA